MYVFVKKEEKSDKKRKYYKSENNFTIIKEGNLIG